MKYFFACMVLALTSSAAFGAEVREFDPANIKKLVVSNPKGEVQIESGPATKKFIVSLEKIKFDKACHFNVDQTSETLSVKIDQDNSLFDKANCVSRLKIEMPSKNTQLEVSTATANVIIKGSSGNIDFKTATGEVRILGDILKNIDGKSATGHMVLSFNKCAGRADVDLMSATGDAEITLPPQCKIKVNHKSATGELFNELGESEDYMVSIVAKSAGGDLKIKKLK